MEKPSIPKGTRDFGPLAMARRQFIFSTIRSVYQKYGFQPLETPSMENLSVLTGKYGEEGDQLLFKILDSGDYLKEIYEDLTFSKIEGIKTFLLYYLDNINIRIESSYIDINPYVALRDELTKPTYFQGFLNISNSTIEVTLKYIRENDVYLVNRINQWLSSFSSGTNFRENFILRSNSRNDVVLDIVEHLKSKYPNKFNPITSRTLTPFISEKGLRYDLTVPFARYVVMNRHEITFPFKRYQIQPVWRADRPQKGRYREFYQCDADVVGTKSLLCEAEIVMMIREVMKGLGIIDFTIKINHRGVLAGLAEVAEAKGKEVALYTAIDKLDKIGEEKVREELSGCGFAPAQLDLLFELLNATGSNAEKLSLLKSRFVNSASGTKGIADLEKVVELLKASGSDESNLQFDIALARGLSYYTGCIFEVKINNVSIGSVSGGGRYDNLTQSFGDKESLSGVGISFGVDRLYDVMDELQLFPKETQRSSTVLICYLDEESMRFGLNVLAALRAAGIASELYPDESKLKKQLDYANKKMIPYTLVIGEEERTQGLLALKNMEAGTQEKLALSDIITRLS